jgi:plastocyanin
MRRRRLAVVAAGAALALPAAALAQHAGDHAMPVAEIGPGPAVSIGFDTYTPPLIDVLTGDAVTWTNNSVRAHTVVARDGSWGSARMIQGDRYEQRFAAAGAYAYFCTLHAGMAGEVDAHDVLLARPATPAGAGRPYPLSGRSAAAPGTVVTIEAGTPDGYVRTAKATVGADGTFGATVTPQTTATYRAVVPDAEPSPPVQLIVLDHTVTVSVRRRGPVSVVAAQVDPPDPGADVVLQLRLKDRFGWWPERFARLDAASRATIVIRAPVRIAPARVLLTLPDRATALAESPVVRLRGDARR